MVSEGRASRRGLRRWWAIDPRADGPSVVLVTFEHDARLDTDGWFAPEDVLDWTEIPFEDMDSLLAHLAEQGIDSEKFVVPWDTDYPL